MKLGIVMPWRAQPHRMKAFEFTHNWYQTNFPDAKIYLADKPGDSWKMGASRNLGVKMAQEDGCDVVIISDADTIGDVGVFKAVIQIAINDRFIHNPYTDSLYFDKESSDKIVNGEPLENLRYETHNSTGGIYICTPIAWWTVGGSDEKFAGWGYEDNAMNYAHGIFHGEGILKHTGKIYSLYHEREESMERMTKNVYNNFLLYRRYIEITSPLHLLQLIKAETWE